MSTKPSDTLQKPWEKNLYGNLDYPDNFTDETFLKDLRTNIDIKEITLFKSIRGTTVLVEEICIVTLFVLVFVFLHNKWVEPEFVFSSTSVLTTLCFFYYRLNFSKILDTTIREDIRTLLIFLIFGYIFAPVLHTLTDTVSTDTIYTMTFLMMCTHLIFYDYGIVAAIVSKSISLNAAMFGSICLASRLASPFHAFVLMVIAVECFVLYPILSSKLNKNIFLIIIPLSTIYLLYQISTTMTILFTLLLVFVNIICPCLFVNFQKYKENIYGPWDEAIVEDVNDVNHL